MAREMYLVGVDESELQPSPKPEPPKGFKGKWANYWYHYKWVTLISLFALVVLIVILVQMFSREKEDYRLALVTEKIVSTTVLEELSWLLMAGILTATARLWCRLKICISADRTR